MPITQVRAWSGWRAPLASRICARKASSVFWATKLVQLSGQVLPEGPPSGHPGPPKKLPSGHAVHSQHGSAQFPQVTAPVLPHPPALPMLEVPSVTRLEAFERPHSKLVSRGSSNELQRSSTIGDPGGVPSVVYWRSVFAKSI